MKNVFLAVILLLTFGIVFTACSGNDNKAKTEQLAKDAACKPDISRIKSRSCC